VRDRSERRTLQALRGGRREAYASIIEAHYQSVYRFLLFLGRDANLAEDLTQEVFASAWRAIETFRGESSIRTWLHRIAYHAFVDVQRRRERDQAVVGGLGRRDGDTADDPLHGILAEESLSEVVRALRDLDLDERTVLVLHYVEGLSYREMAQILGRPDGTLKWITSRALEKLRRRFIGKVNS
jgi:RNA polymerase sigma-70 factor (ECF subfamily)